MNLTGINVFPPTGKFLSVDSLEFKLQLAPAISNLKVEL